MELTNLTLSTFTGALLGCFYMGILWMTVSRISKSSRPITTLAMGALVRMGSVTTAMFLFSDLRAEPLIGMLAGFVLARQTVIALVKADHSSGTPAPQNELGTP